MKPPDANQALKKAACAIQGHRYVFQIFRAQPYKCKRCGKCIGYNSTRRF